VRFQGCSLQGTDFSRAEMTEVDLRGSDLSQLGGEVAALRGAIVDTAQLIDLAHPLAAAAGLKVEDGDQTLWIPTLSRYFYGCQPKPARIRSFRAYPKRAARGPPFSFRIAA
jgi:hypothetical protein